MQTLLEGRYRPDSRRSTHPKLTSALADQRTMVVRSNLNYYT